MTFPPTATKATALLLCLLLTCPWAAASDDLGVTVTGIGESPARPDCLEIDIRAAGAAELSGDAILKYHDRLRRVTEAFKKLDIKQLRLEQRELSIGDAANEQRPRPHVTIARALRIMLTDIHEMAEDDLLAVVGKVIDAAKDTGAGEEPQTGLIAVRFAVRDAKRVRAEACRRAFEHAREEATELATLAGGRVGRAVSVQDMSSATNSNVVAETIYAIYGRDAEPDEPGRIISDNLQEIPVRVSLRVRFELLQVQDELPNVVEQ